MCACCKEPGSDTRKIQLSLSGSHKSGCEECRTAPEQIEKQTSYFYRRAENSIAIGFTASSRTYIPVVQHEGSVDCALPGVCSVTRLPKTHEVSFIRDSSSSCTEDHVASAVCPSIPRSIRALTHFNEVHGAAVVSWTGFRSKCETVDAPDQVSRDFFNNSSASRNSCQTVPAQSREKPIASTIHRRGAVRYTTSTAQDNLLRHLQEQYATLRKQAIIRPHRRSPAPTRSVFVQTSPTEEDTQPVVPNAIQAAILLLDGSPGSHPGDAAHRYISDGDLRDTELNPTMGPTGSVGHSDATETARCSRRPLPNDVVSEPRPTPTEDTQTPQTDAVDSYCIVCTHRPRDRVALPCAHLVTCSVCLHRLDKCPVCRQQILASVKVCA